MSVSTTRADEPLRAGIVGCDTSHVIAFTKLLNDPAATGPLAKIEVTCAFPGGSADIPDSRDRVQGFTEQLRGMGVEIVDSIAALVERSDVILLESVDGRPHLEQFRQLAVGKPVFIDKPMAASLADVIAIYRVAKETNTPCFSSSALRFSENLVALKNNADIGPLTGCSVASPYSKEPHHPSLFWYGVHGVESVYTLMGPGCETVSRVETEAGTVVVGKWRDGRLAVYRGLKGHDYAFTVFGEKGMAFQQGFSGYEPHVRQVCEFFLTRKPPVSPDETTEIFAFMEASDESLAAEGRSVEIDGVIQHAKEKAEVVLHKSKRE
jgi:predicted dehydrogenase